MDATSRARWRRVATVVGLVCVAAQLCAVAALPAPPDVTGAQTFLDIATPPPITEDELHNMVEQLLMEAYGDEYEPPPSRLKNKNTKETKTSFSSTAAGSGTPRSISASDADIAETLLILQQQEKLFEIQQQREKLHQMQKQLQEEQRQQQEQQQQMFIQSTNTPPIIKGSLILHQQLSESPRDVPSSVPTLDKPRVLHGKNTDAPNLMLTTQPPVSVQPLGTTMSKPRGIPSPDELQKALVFQQENQPGVLIVDRRKKSKTEKSKGARQLLLHHHHNNHQASGSTLITSFTTTPTTTMHHTRTPTKQIVIKRGRSSNTTTPSLPLSSLINNTRSTSVEPARSLKRETKPESVEGGNLASRNGRSPQRNSAKPEQLAERKAPQQVETKAPRQVETKAPRQVKTKAPQQVERKAPVIESAKLLSHIVSEDMQPFHKVQDSTKQMVSGSAPRPFTLPSPVNNPNPVQIKPVPQEQQKALTVDIADEDLMMLQLLGSQLSQAARVQSTQNLLPSQPQNSGQASSNNQPANLHFVMQPRTNNDDKRIVINLGNMENQLHSTSVPVQLNAGINDNFIRHFRNNDQAKAISSGNTFQDFSSSTQKLHPVNQNSNGRVTVGDLVMSLNGQNGIRVVSLGDLRNNANVGSSVSNDDAHLLQQLRNAMISGNINTLQNQQLNFGVPLPSLNQGSHHSNHGVPLPTLVNQNHQGSNAVGRGNAGRQFDFLFGNENQNSQNTVDFNGGGSGNSGGSGVINDLLFDSSISVGRPGDSIPQSGGAGSLDDFFVNANSGNGGSAASGSSLGGAGDLDDIFRSSDTSSSSTGSVGVPLPAATAQDPLPDSFTTTSDTASTGTTALEDNTNFDFGSYEDDFPELPPQPPNVFRTGISDIFFTKGQWIGTLLGGLFDVGSAVGSSVSKLFKKGSRETTTPAST